MPMMALALFLLTSLWLVPSVLASNYTFIKSHNYVTTSSYVSAASCTPPPQWRNEDVGEPWEFDSPHSNGSAPAFFKGLGSGCQQCCFYRPILSQAWSWVPVEVATAVVGTAYIIINPRHNTTSTSTIVLDQPITVGLEVFDPDQWQKNGTFTKRFLKQPRTEYFTDLTGRTRRLAFPNITTQIAPYQNWLGQFQTSSIQQTQCVKNNGGPSPLPIPLITPAPYVPTREPNDFGLYWDLVSHIRPPALKLEQIISMFGDCVAASVQKSCLPVSTFLASGLSAKEWYTSITTVHYLITTSTVYGSLVPLTSPGPAFPSSTSVVLPPTSFAESSLPFVTNSEPYFTFTEPATRPIERTSVDGTASSPAVGEPGHSDSTDGHSTVYIKLPEYTNGQYTQESATNLDSMSLVNPTLNQFLSSGDLSPERSEYAILGASDTISTTPTATIISGTTYSVAGRTHEVVINGVTSTLLATPLSTILPPAPSIFTIPGGKYTLSAGQPPVVISGTTYSVVSTGGEVVINGITSTIPASPPSPEPSVYIIPGSHITLSAGQATVISGMTYSIISTGGEVVINGHTSAIFTAPPPPSVFVVPGADVTISAGESATVVDGTTYSVVATGGEVVVDRSTIPLTSSGQIATMLEASHSSTHSASASHAVNGKTSDAAGQRIDRAAYALAVFYMIIVLI